MDFRRIGLLNFEVIFDSQAEFANAKERLSFKHPKAFIIKKKCPWKRNWDGMTTMIKPEEWRGPNQSYKIKTGMLGRLLEGNADISVDDLLPHINIPYEPLLLGDKVLSPEQQLACESLLKTSHGSVQMETGSGKTLILANAASCLHRSDPISRFLLLVPRVGLMRQIHKELNAATEALRFKVGMAGDGTLDLKDKILLVATPDTVNASNSEELRDWLLTVTCVIVDECHHAPADKYQDAINTCTNANILWGVSGKTEFLRSTQKDKEIAIESVFGKSKHSGKAPERLSPFKVCQYKMTSWKGQVADSLSSGLYDNCEVAFKTDPNEKSWKVGVYHGFDVNGVPSSKCRTMVDGKLKVDKKKFGIYYKGEQVLDAHPHHTVYKTQHDVGIMEFKPRNEWAVGLAKGFAEKKEPFLCTVMRTRHALKIYNAMLKAGIRIGYVSGELSGKEQLEVFAQLARGEIDGVVAIYTCVSEGIDIPYLIHGIKLDGIGSEQVLEQQKGRLQRTHPQKECGYLHIPIDYQTDVLARKSRSIIAYYVKRGFETIKFEDSSG